MFPIMVTAAVPVQIFAIMGGTVTFWVFSSSTASLESRKRSHCQSRTSLTQAGHLDTLPLFLSQDVSPPESHLSGAQLDWPLSGPGGGQYRTGHSGCSLDGEAVGPTRLVHAQAFLLQQTSYTLLADRPPGPGRTHTPGLVKHTLTYM